MDRNKAIASIESTFDSSFNKEQFILFIQNLLNDIDMSRYREYRGNLIKEAFRDHISQYYRVGKYTDPNGVELDVLIVEVKDETKLDRARTSLRNFVINHLNTFEKEYALSAFYSKTDNGRNWRFSFIKLEHQTLVKEGKIKQQKELTPAKRYSFLVGEDEKCHTAKRQLLPLLQNVYNNPLIKDLEDAFSIEVVTDEFYEQYKGLFIHLSEVFSSNNQLLDILISSGLDIPRFTKKLLGQIVFLYFLQKKGWLGVPKNGNWGDGQKNFLQEMYRKADNKGHNFFKDYLQYLFYEALAHQHGKNNYYERFDCRIPFLNGGLFEADYEWNKANITLPNSLFRNQEKINKTGDIGTGVLDVFDRYNFTIREDEPLEKEVAVDPEMLGKVFENMLEITERKSKGAFYTPREIVHYMCQESLIHYLDNSVNNNTPNLIPKEDIENFVHNGVFTVENDALISEKEHETDTYKYKLSENIRVHADTLDRLITGIKICDPAIGSGAFPVGLLNELVGLQLVLKKHLSEKYLSEKLQVIGLAEEEYQTNPERYNYRIKRHNIQESIYGVDIDASAIDIARLRLWLSLVVDEEDFDNIEALPNLDYKIVCGNSLIGMPEGTVRNVNIEDELEKLKEDFFSEKDDALKKGLRNKINKKLHDLLDSVEAFCKYEIDFDFKLFFSEVWREKGGFDIVIGNPPYNELRDLTIVQQEDYKNSKHYAHAKGGRINIFQFFYPLAIDISKQRGIISLITQNSILGEKSALNNRKLIFDTTKILRIDSFPERDDVNKRVFKQAKMSVAILLLSKEKRDDLFCVNIWADRYFSLFKRYSINKKNIKDIYYSELLIPNTNEEQIVILKKIRNRSNIFNIKAFSGEIDMTKYKDRFKTNISDYRVITGAQVQRYFITDSPSQGNVIYLDSNSLNIAHDKMNYVKSSRIVMQRITGVDSKIRIISTIIPPGQLCANSTNFVVGDLFALLFIIGILNSELINFYFKQTSTNTNITTEEIGAIPFINANFLNKKTLGILTKLLLEINKINGKRQDIVYCYFENLVNTFIYELYFPEEIHSANKGIIEYLHDLHPIDDTMSNEEKLSIINSEYERLYDPYHPVRNNVDTIESVEIVRIIKEALRK